MNLFAPSILAIFCCCILASPGAAEGFRSDSKRFSSSKMDIVITEVERLPRTSVVDMQVKSVGSSVGSSFFILCSLRDLARERGGFRYIVKLEERPGRGEMLVGFLKSADERPESVDSRFAGAVAIDLDKFAPICDSME